MRILFLEIQRIYVVARIRMCLDKAKLGKLHVRFEVFTAVTMKNVFFWDIETQFILHRKYITSPLPSPVG
jgi:hypothetical protein